MKLMNEIKNVNETFINDKSIPANDAINEVIVEKKWNPEYLLADGKTFSPFFVRAYLEKKGFAQFMSGMDRTAARFYYRNDNNVLKLYSPKNIHKFVTDELVKTYEDTSLSDEEKLTIVSIIDKWSKYSGLEREVLQSIKTFGEFDTEDSQMIEMAKDTRDQVYVRFKNGVVVVTKNDIKMVPYKELKNNGSVWEKNIINKEIHIDYTKGLFEEFCLNAMRVRDNTIEEEDDWTKQFPITEDVEKNFKSLMSSYGYAIQSDNTVEKFLLYIDRDSTITERNGGNGKSLISESMQHFTDRCFVNGTFFFNGKTNSQFAFDAVTPSTGVIQIDEINKGFDSGQIFATITGDMEIQRKNKEKIIIPRARKPKMVLTSNYVLEGQGQSFNRRSHVVEFGNYWNMCNSMQETPSDPKHLGKRLFDEFTSDDWNQYYTFGFKCIQTFLKEGLVEGSKGSYEERVQAMTIAREPEVQEWLRNYILKDRIKLSHHIDGVAKDDLYMKFIGDIDETTSTRYSQPTKFFKMLFAYVESLDGYEWNAHKTDKGDSMSDRRWYVGNPQKEFIKITHV